MGVGVNLGFLVWILGESLPNHISVSLRLLVFTRTTHLWGAERWGGWE